jgi:hypothetical protein
VTVKLAELFAAGTVTEGGVVSSALLSDKLTAVADDAAALRVTVQVLEPPDGRVAGLHESEDNVTVEPGPLTVPPVPGIEIALPLNDAPRPLKPIEVLRVPAAIVRCTVAMTPFGITLAFSPDAMQV